VVERQGKREFITIKPYARIVAGLATALPPDADQLPPFNPFKLYSDSTPLATEGATDAAPQLVSISVFELANGMLPEEDGVELRPEQIIRFVAEAAENFATAESPYNMGLAADEIAGRAMLHQVAYRPDDGAGAASLFPNTTVIQKSADESDEDSLDELPAGALTKTVSVARGNTLMSILIKVGAETGDAKAIADAITPQFSADDLKPGQEVRIVLVPAPSDSGQMEPARVSIFAKGDVHLATVARAKSGDFEPATLSVEAIAAASELKAQQQQRATLYTSFYHAALGQKLAPDTILRLLRVHSYDVDFKQKVKTGDSFEVFLDTSEDDDDGDGAATGEVLYTSMTVADHTRHFYRFRTPDGAVDYYDETGNSAKKFLMRKPVKGSRYTSGFGGRKHPLLRRWRMHTGVDWGAPRGTPILAAGDATVEKVGRQGGYGNYIRLRHANGFATAYGHLSRYAPGLAAGITVKQGQVIGFVGSTGFSTGPHLHYEVLVNNKHVNPMTIQVPRGLQLTGKELAYFQKERKRIEALMRSDPVTTRVAQATQ
jgi:murein DD-endopeptidase MepM/ murein hydrolase activator NlpD